MKQEEGEEAQKLVHGINIEIAETKLELTVDEVVEGYVGSLGISQLLHVFLVSLAWIFDSQNTLATIFSDAQPPSWRCISPHLHADNTTVVPAMAAASLCSSIGDSKGGGSVCGLPPGRGSGLVGIEAPLSLSGVSSVIERSGVFGFLADAYLGRKRTMLLSCILTSTTAFLTSLSPNIWIYSLLRFANGFARSGIGICCLVLSTESVGRKWRGQVGQCGFFFFSAGFLSLPLIAYHCRTSWRSLYQIISLLPLVYSLLFLPFVSESPRWLLIRGRSKEALEILQRYARLNGKMLPSNLSLANPSMSKVGGEALAETKSTEKESLWTTRWAAKRMIVVMITGFGVGFVYYGVQLNVENLNFNLYFTVALNALMEIPAVVIGTILSSFTNRRLLFSQSAFIAGVSCILCIVFSHGGRAKADESGGSWPQLIIEGIGFMAASTAFNILYIYCVELFPTNVRNSAVSMLRQALMLGASISPLMVVLGRLSPSLSFLVFGFLSIFSGVMSSWLPETKNAPLYETLKQQEEDEKQSSEVK
ncbi:hypothetical protein GH714_033848 [Hevea brasiliensis]|uniref:Major facilitator superfamily (MFS) profile domain-containing protein n=1 Tax=Hevea brasiliensis TaxID=3981 RepID=A0A6A6N6M3_HEVBR|nr:hypothetical protein GH714_033848 [Hevea brasiliensis]